MSAATRFAQADAQESVLIDVAETAAAIRAVAHIAARGGQASSEREWLSMLSAEELASLMRLFAGRLEASYQTGQALLVQQRR